MQQYHNLVALCDEVSSSLADPAVTYDADDLCRTAAAFARPTARYDRFERDLSSSGRALLEAMSERVRGVDVLRGFCARHIAYGRGLGCGCGCGHGLEQSQGGI